MTSARKRLIGTVVAALGLLAVTVPATSASSASTGSLRHRETIVGLGNDTTETLFDKLAADYNRQSPRTHLRSFWATGTTPITTKAGCAPIARPDGSSPGIAAFAHQQTLPDGSPCIDFVRSIAPRAPGAPANSVFLPFAQDAVTYAINAHSHAPTSMTASQLAEILQCQVRHWSQVGGTGNGTILPLLPARGPGMNLLLHRWFGISGVGACVQTAQQDEGTDPRIRNNPNALAFYAIGKYLAQTEYHHADVHGDLVLGGINGIAPTVYNPADRRTEINLGQVPTVTGLPTSLRLDEFVVVASRPDKTIAPPLRHLFVGAGSWICGPQARADIRDYGFLPLSPEQCGRPQ